MVGAKNPRAEGDDVLIKNTSLLQVWLNLAVRAHAIGESGLRQTENLELGLAPPPQLAPHRFVDVAVLAGVEHSEAGGSARGAHGEWKARGGHPS
jgi:hypothetical protein